ncbi:acyltransferase family protein [Chryseomicrobium sp. FSL W7-1435]|uniref:acyltransferase family protein n=1 Tax=Chryseomicrobium sp. FSL W7-1435 TaxID=2921704 RepID=UPI00315B0815
MAKKRIHWLDAAKGFLMILVVLGHYPHDMPFPLIQYIYWFHMPAFFLLSGIFFKEVYSLKEAKGALTKRFMQLLFPYFFFLLAITTIRYSIELATFNFDWRWYTEDFVKILIGGRFARGAYGVIWFITTLYFSYVIFTLLTLYAKRYTQWLILALLYTIAHIQSFWAMDVVGGEPDQASQTIPMLWNLDVAFIAVVYFAIGSYLKQFWLEVPHRTGIAAVVVTAVAVITDRLGWIDYHLSLKFLRYNHFFLDLIIPIAMIIVFVWVFQLLAAKWQMKPLQFIESHSIAIMYLHIFTYMVLNDYFLLGPIGFTITGIIFPIVASIAIRKLIPQGELLLGNISKFYVTKRQVKKSNG